MKYFLYHGKHQEKKERPQEDFFVNNDNIFIVADGITHDLINGVYPKPSDSYLVAKIASKSILDFLKNNFKNKNSIKEAFALANKKIAKFQKNRTLFKNREKNNYTYGAAVIVVAILKENKLFYGVLDDCRVSLFNKNLNNRLNLFPYVKNSAEYLLKKYSWDDLSGRKFWRKNIRNHKIKVGNKTFGYGVLDGLENFEPFLQIGEIDLKKDDLVCVYSDGFIKPLKDKNFIKKIYNFQNSPDLTEYISEYMEKNGYNNEKSCYFIK